MADKCTVRAGKFVKPCDTLEAASEPFFSHTKARGIYACVLTNLTTGKPSRTFFIIRTRLHPKGLALNVCPWCGERIDAPFVEDEPAQHRTHATDAGESLCGIAIRQLGDESRWTEIRDLNADRFPDMLGSDYYPVGTIIKLPGGAR